MRTAEVLRRIDRLDRATLDAVERAGWIEPGRLSAGDDGRWWGPAQVNQLRDIARFLRRGLSLEDAYRRAREDRFFGLCPCDWR